MTQGNHQSVEGRSDFYKRNLRRWISRNYPNTDNHPMSRRRRFLEDFEERLFKYHRKEYVVSGYSDNEAKDKAKHHASRQRAYLRSILSDATGNQRHLSTDMVARIESLFSIAGVLIDLSPSEQKVPCYVLVQCAPNSIDEILRHLICHPIVDEVAGVIGDVDIILRIWATPESCRDFLWFGLQELKANEGIHRTTTYMPVGSTYHTKLALRAPRGGEPTEIRKNCIYSWHPTRGVLPSNDIMRELNLQVDMGRVDRIYQAGDEMMPGGQVIGMVLRSTGSVKQSVTDYNKYFSEVDHANLYKTSQNNPVKCYPLRGGDVAQWHLTFFTDGRSDELIDEDLRLLIENHNQTMESISKE